MKRPWNTDDELSLYVWSITCSMMSPGIRNCAYGTPCIVLMLLPSARPNTNTYSSVWITGGQITWLMIENVRTISRLISVWKPTALTIIGA